MDVNINFFLSEMLSFTCLEDLQVQSTLDTSIMLNLNLSVNLK